MGRLRALSDFKESGDDERPMYRYCLSVQMKCKLETVPLETSSTMGGGLCKTEVHTVILGLVFSNSSFRVSNTSGSSTNKAVNVLVMLEYMLVRHALKTVILIRLRPY
jgi:hypothetical protein